MDKSKATIVINEIIQKMQMIIGVFLIFFGIAGICTFIGQFDSGAIFVIIFCLGVGSWLINSSVKKKRLIKNFRTYVQELSNDPTGSIYNLASATGTSVDVVKNNLQNMINKKFFVNACIDAQSNCIIFPAINNNINDTQSNVPRNTNHSEIEYVSVTCKNCGGTNTVIKGKVSECDFCGSPITGE